MKRCIEILISVLLVGVIGYLGWRVAFEPRYQNQSSRQALEKLHENLRLGDSQQRILELYSQFQTDRTRLRKDTHANVWEIGMPFELGAGDWILYIEFDDSKRLSAAVFRTSDGIFRRPRNSPEDIGEFALAMRYKNPG